MNTVYDEQYTSKFSIVKELELIRDEMYSKGHRVTWHRSRPWEWTLIVNSAHIQPGDKILDVGTASSPLPIYLRRKLNCEVHCIDIEECNTISYFALNRINYHLLNVVKEELPFPNNYFDLIYSSCVLEHLEAHGEREINVITRFLDHCLNKLKPGGVLAHTVDFNSHPPIGIFCTSTLREIFSRLGSRIWHGPFDYDRNWPLYYEYNYPILDPPDKLPFEQAYTAASLVMIKER